MRIAKIVVFALLTMCLATADVRLLLAIRSNGIAQRAVLQANGYWSATPGWPEGADVISLHEYLEENHLVRTIEAQHHNQSLSYLSLENQQITDRVAESVASLKSIKTLNTINCKITPSAATIILSSRCLEVVYADTDSASMLRNIAEKSSSTIKITEFAFP